MVGSSTASKYGHLAPLKLQSRWSAHQAVVHLLEANASSADGHFEELVRSPLLSALRSSPCQSESVVATISSCSGACLCCHRSLGKFVRPHRQTTSFEPVSRQKRILNIIAEIDTESQLARLRQLTVQGRWLEWTNAMHSDLSWRRLIHGLDDGELQFNLRAISNTLPTLDNLRRWGQKEVDPACPLCGRPATLRHILNSCSVALQAAKLGDMTRCLKCYSAT